MGVVVEVGKVVVGVVEANSGGKRSNGNSCGSGGKTSNGGNGGSGGSGGSGGVDGGKNVILARISTSAA